jgi:zinc protease
LEPRWDAKEFDLIKQSVTSSIQRQKANPNAIAANEYAKLLYGENHILAQNNQGTEASVEAITIEDLKNYYNTNLTPKLASLNVVGDISKAEVTKNLESINTRWEAKDITIPEIPTVQAPEKGTVYFYDVPNAKQSQLRFGYPAPKATDDDYFAAGVMNYRLGGGGFASQLTQQLREGKGYTYGIRSRFSGDENSGNFTISSGVRSNVTYESAALVKDILDNYAKGFDSNDLEVTKGYTIKSNARAFETLGAKLRMLSNISDLGYDDDYAKQQEEIVKALTVEDMKSLAGKYLRPDQMIYLVVGDAKTQLDKLEQLGFGKPVLLNPTFEALDK